MQYLSNGTLQVLLKLTQVTEEDFKTRFTLQVENGRSHATYRIMLSKDENQSGEILGNILSFVIISSMR